MKKLLIILLLFRAPICNSQALLAPTSNGASPSWKSIVPAGYIQRPKPIIPPGPFTPASVANMIAWYDVTDLANIVISAGRVTSLKDKSGNAHHMNAVSTGPQYFTTGGANNLAYMHITDGNEIYATGVASAQPYTVYLVLKPSSFTTGGRILRMDGSNGLYMQEITQSAGQTIKMSANAGAPNWVNTYRENWELLSTIWNNINWKLQVNNEPYLPSPSSANSGGIGNNPMATLGWGPHNGTTATADIEELIVYTGLVNATNDSLIRKFLVDKYGPAANWVALFFGDSITEGAAASDPNSNSYPALVCIDSLYQYVNFGVSSTVAIARPPSNGVAGKNLQDIYTVPINEKVDWSHTRVFFSFSRNDLNTDATWVTQYEAIVQTYLNLGIAANHIYMCTQPAYASGGSAALTGAFLTTYNNLKQVATDKGVIFVDIINYQSSTFDPAWISGDGVHPTTAGHRAIANAVESYIQ